MKENNEYFMRAKPAIDKLNKLQKMVEVIYTSKTKKQASDAISSLNEELFGCKDPESGKEKIPESRYLRSFVVISNILGMHYNAAKNYWMDVKLSQGQKYVFHNRNLSNVVNKLLESKKALKTKDRKIRKLRSKLKKNKATVFNTYQLLCDYKRQVTGLTTKCNLLQGIDMEDSVYNVTDEVMKDMNHKDKLIMYRKARRRLMRLKIQKKTWEKDSKNRNSTRDDLGAYLEEHDKNDEMSIHEMGQILDDYHRHPEEYAETCPSYTNERTRVMPRNCYEVGDKVNIIVNGNMVAGEVVFTRVRHIKEYDVSYHLDDQMKQKHVDIGLTSAQMFPIIDKATQNRFKVGDKVRLLSNMHETTIESIEKDNGEPIYIVKIPCQLSKTSSITIGCRADELKLIVGEIMQDSYKKGDRVWVSYDDKNQELGTVMDFNKATNKYSIMIIDEDYHGNGGSRIKRVRH